MGMIRWLLVAVFVQASLGCLSAEGDASFDAGKFSLTIASNAVPRSLVIKGSGEECLSSERPSLFSVTQERPFNNEIKLAYLNKRMAFAANRVRREGDRLIVGFDIAPYEAVVGVRAGDGYLLFTLEGFRCDGDLAYSGLNLDVPPASSFRILQLPVRARKNFGDWVNASWDDSAAVAVVGSDPYAAVDHERRGDGMLLTADLTKGMRLIGGGAAVVAGAGEGDFLSSMDAFERDLGLPQGVASRRNPLLNASIYWMRWANPKNIDDHIALAKRGGFRMMLMFISCFLGTEDFADFGDYALGADYPNGLADVRSMVGKMRVAGMTPGLHVLQTHIGCRSSYVTPSADPRLDLTRRFTLAERIPAAGDPKTIYVFEDPVDSPMADGIRVLKFGGELFTYESYSRTRPYRFEGVRRGHWKTAPVDHLRGEIGGILHVTEYWAKSCYIDQRTDLQDEIAEKISRIYDTGMEFCYFDGSEGVNPPCGVNVALSQYRVVSKFARPPLFTEGAAKSHFRWHLQSGANAFDAFPPEIFKEMIVAHPMAEAPRMRQNMTRLDFGWWYLYLPGEKVQLRNVTPYREVESVGVQLDMWEFGTSRAAAWDCPVAVMLELERKSQHPRLDDLLEVMRRWEDVRAKGWLTQMQKEALKSPTQEHHLYLNERGEYELCEIEMLPTPDGAKEVRAFLFEREGKRVIAYWHMSGSGTLEVALGADDRKTVVPADHIRYLTTELSNAAVKSSWRAVRLVDSEPCGDKPRERSLR